MTLEYINRVGNREHSESRNSLRGHLPELFYFHFKPDRVQHSMSTTMASVIIGPNSYTEDIMGALTSRPGTHGRRAACDRCRGQKLRCSREDNHEASNNSKCIRCNTAGAICSFSSAKRPGRPPASLNSLPAERKGKQKSGARRQTGKQSGCTKIADYDVAEGQQGQDYDQSQSAPTLTDDEGDIDMGRTSSADDFLTHPLNDLSMRDPDWKSLVDISLPDEGITAFYNELSQSGLDSFGCGHDWSLPTALSSNLESKATATLFQGLGDQMSESSPLMFDQRQTSVQSQAGTNEKVLFDLATLNSTPETKGSENSSNEVPSESLTSDDDAQHRRMQELSELGMDLYSQLVANEEYLQAQTTTGSLGLRGDLVGNILKSSATFLNLLKTFYPSSSTKSAAKAFAPESTDGDNISPPFASICTDIPSIGAEHPQASQQEHSVTSNIQDATRPVTADMTTIFQLLTCYIRVIRLHSIIYMQVHDYLITVPSKRELPLPPIFPGIEVGGFPLDVFRNFQVKLLLQILAHLLGEIEMLLGLPEGYRVSKKDRQSQGILEASVSGQFVEMTMRENGRAGVEWDRFKSIADKLGSLRVLLKGAINI